MAETTIEWADFTFNPWTGASGTMSPSRKDHEVKNKLSDLNDHLFAQMERLGVEGITPEQLEIEVKRAEAMVKVADQISSNADLQLRAARLFADHGAVVLPMLPQIGGKTQAG